MYHPKPHILRSDGPSKRILRQMPETPSEVRAVWPFPFFFSRAYLSPTIAIENPRPSIVSW